ncbi:hypothetical protein [Microbulbifer halophilus]|uniref:hypothetical protein n=1 Tax=Microbulbifer halophilus TaxID=453963 RepID=UPI00361C3357
MKLHGSISLFSVIHARLSLCGRRLPPALTGRGADPNRAQILRESAGLCQFF